MSDAALRTQSSLESQPQLYSPHHPPPPSLSKSASVVFYISKYKNVHCAHIRRFINIGSYSGPTKHGVTIGIHELQALLDHLRAIPNNENHDSDICRIPLRPNRVLKLSLRTYDGRFGIDIREFVNIDGDLKPTIKGVRIPFRYFRQTIEGFDKTLDQLKNY